MSTTSMLRAALFGVLATSAAAHADTKAHRVVILEFDGPRALADSGHDAVVHVLAQQYDIVASKRWLDAKSDAGASKRGPRAWAVASSKTGVEAVVEGWVQEDSSKTRTLSVVITDATSGKSFETVTLKLPTGSVGEDTLFALRKELDKRLDWLAATGDDIAEPKASPTDKVPIGTTDNPPAKGPKQVVVVGPELPPTEPAPTVVATAEVSTTKPLEPAHVDYPMGEPTVAKTYATKRFWFAGGPGYASRSLNVLGESPDDLTQYASVPHKSIGIEAAFFPFPLYKTNAVPNGFGVTIAMEHSLGSTVTFDNLDEVGDYSINQYAWNAGVHYRVPVGMFAIDGELGYGQSSYKLTDAPPEFEVPDTSYQYLSAGAHVDLSITERASVGFGGKYLHIMDQGDLTSVDWYGPGKSSGWQFDGNFKVPLPANLFVAGEIKYTRIHTSFDGVGQITEDTGAYEANDSTIGGTVKVGVQF